MLLCYCGMGSTIRNTRDFARNRCAACVVPSSLPFFGRFAIHSQSTEKFTLGRRKEIPHHFPNTFQTPHSTFRVTAPAPQSFCCNRSHCFALPFSRPVFGSVVVRFATDIAARSAAKPISHHGHASLSRIPLMNVSLASFVYHSRGVEESSVAPDNPRTPRIT